MNNAVTGRDKYLYSHLKEELNKAEEIKIIVSFLKESGVKLIVDDLKKQALRGAEIKIITSKYLNITEPSALYLLKNKLGDLAQLRFFDNDNNVSFHPKAYFFKNSENKTLFIGSSNISQPALISGVEWNYRLVSNSDQEAYHKFEREFDRIFANQTVVIDRQKLKEYASSWQKPRVSKVLDNAKQEEKDKKPEPRGAQIEALYELELAREEGVAAGMVVAATGVGKTYLAAFDSINFNKVLFLAHREEILNQAANSYRTIKPDLKISFFNGNEKDASGDIVFASVQTLRKNRYLNEYFEEDEFDYIIVDEFHHAAANSYKNVLEYFTPQFLLGLTATPYRMDNKDIYEICNDNLIYEIDLKDAINRDLLVPFKYYGIYDDQVDYTDVKFSNGKYNTKGLEKKLATHKRADLVLEQYNNLAGKRTLGFCASIQHARFMAQHFNDNKIRAVCVHSAKSKSDYYMARDEAVEKLESKEIDVIFAVDIFNEGVDIPALDTVLFLRPTESYVVFLQQLGRGLRKYQDKEHLKVLDFIGNYKRAHYIPFLLSGKNPMEQKKKSITKIEEFDFPKNCDVSFDFKVISLFKEMSKNDPLRKRMEEEYFRLKKYLGERPLRKDIYNGVDIDIKEYLKRKYKGQKGYLRFLARIDELNAAEQNWLDTIVEEFLIYLEGTRLTKSYKLPVLLSLLTEDKLKFKVRIEDVGESYMKFYKGSKLHRKDFNNKKHRNWQEWSKERYTKEAVKNPVKYLSKRKLFIYDEVNNYFMLHKDLKPYLKSKKLVKHVKDILEYRETRYFKRRFKEED